MEEQKIKAHLNMLKLHLDEMERMILNTVSAIYDLEDKLDVSIRSKLDDESLAMLNIGRNYNV